MSENAAGSSLSRCSDEEGFARGLSSAGLEPLLADTPAGKQGSKELGNEQFLEFHRT